MERPIAVVLTALYMAGFSVVLVGLILWQWLGGHIHGHWTDLIAVMPIALLVALVPAVIAFGLWVLDNAARIAAMLFTLLHLISCIAWLQQPHVPSLWFTSFRIAVDLAILVAFIHPSVRKAFRWQPTHLSLRDAI